MPRKGIHFHEAVAIQYIRDAGASPAEVLPRLTPWVSRVTQLYIYEVREIQALLRLLKFVHLPEVRNYVSRDQRSKFFPKPKREKWTKAKKPKVRASRRVDIW